MYDFGSAVIFLVMLSRFVLILQIVMSNKRETSLCRFRDPSSLRSVGMTLIMVFLVNCFLIASNSSPMKHSIFFSLLLLVPLLSFAQSQGGGVVLDAPRTYKKISGDSVRLRASKAAEIEKVAQRTLAKIVQAGERNRRAAARELARKYKLGDRVIVRGDSGRDVRSVANALVKKLYIKPENVISTFDNGALLDGELYNALLRFQKDKGLPADGKVTKEVVKELRKRK